MVTALGERRCVDAREQLSILSFGDGIDRPSLGTCVFPIAISQGHANQTNAIIINVFSDVVMAGIPLLISKKTLVATQCQLGFIASILSIEGNVAIQLKTRPLATIAYQALLYPRHLMTMRKMQQSPLKIACYRQP